MKAFVILMLIIIAIFVAIFIIKRTLKDKQETITAFTGGLGSGKTFLTVLKATARYLRNLGKYYRKKVWHCFKNLFRKKENKKPWTHDKPILLSNIPVGIKKVRDKETHKKKWLYCQELKVEHLLLQEAIPLGSVVILDEVSAVASQYDFSKHNVKDVMDEFFRLFRHYVSNPQLKIQSYLFVNDQCSENINLVIRRRLNTVHNLSNFKVFLGHFIIYFERQINISEEIKTVDIKQGAGEADTQDNAGLTFKFVWRKPKYDTYCYHNRYKRVPKRKIRTYTGFQKDTLMKCPYDTIYEAKTAPKQRKKRKE